MSIPALRFKEFSSDWEEKTLGDIGENIIGLTYSPSNITDDKSYPIVLRSSNIKNDMLDLNDQVRVKEKIPEKLFTNRDDILICTRNGSQRLIGKNVLISNTEIPMTFGAFMSVYRSPFNKFMVHLFKTDNYNEQIQMNLGARINQITTKNLNAFSFWFPSLQEQTKIANFLTAVDEKISLLTQKATLLSQYKKGVMQQIFSQELRFKDDDGQEYPEWEERQADEVFMSVSNKNHNGDLPILAATQDKGMIYREDSGLDIKSSESSVKSYKIVEKGDFVISLRSFQGGIEYSNLMGICSPAYTVMKPKIEINNGYFKAFLKKEDFIERLNGLVIGIRDGKQISYSAFATLTLPYPAIEEQTKIANFLTAIDEKITTNQTQLNAVKQYKQGLLQQMFV